LLKSIDLQDIVDYLKLQHIAFAYDGEIIFLNRGKTQGEVQNPWQGTLYLPKYFRYFGKKGRIRDTLKYIYIKSINYLLNSKYFY